MGFECCMNCRERRPDCHGSCVNYKVAKDSFDRQQQKIKEKKWVDVESRLARNDGIRRMMRKD